MLKLFEVIFFFTNLILNKLKFYQYGTDEEIKQKIQKIIKNKTLKKIAYAITGLFLLFYGYQVVTIDLADGFPQIILFFNVFLLLFVIALFLLDTFKTDLILEINHYYPFWFSLGLIVVYLGMVPSIIISKISSSTMTSGLWVFITFIINFVGYGILLIGLLKAKKIVR